MESVFKSLSQHTPEFLLGLMGFVVILLLVVLWQQRQLASIRSRWKGLLQGAKGESLERLLMDHLRERVELETQLKDAQGRIQVLERKMNTTKRFVGLVRYDAFEDVGGQQSFALAVYDDEGNGAVLNGVLGRTDCRVFCKPLVGGRSDRNLSQEEARAIEEAARPNAKPVIST